MSPSGATRIPPKVSLSSFVLVAPPCRVQELLLDLSLQNQLPRAGYALTLYIALQWRPPGCLMVACFGGRGLDRGHLLPAAIGYTPTPLTGAIMIFVPCLNSSLEFILVFGLRCAILTPSFAFLLWALEKITVSSILRCSNISTSIFLDL